MSFNLKDEFFDIVFNIPINKDTYNFQENEYLAPLEKYIWKYVYIFGNGFVLLGCIYTLIFILFPIIYFRISQNSKKNPRISREFPINNNSNAELLKERFTSEENI